MKGEIIPTVFSINKKQFQQRFDKLSKTSKKLQIDFMDGKFVKNKSIGMRDIPNLKKYNNSFEAHLMVSRPRRWLIDLKKKGFKRVIFHFETQDNDKQAEEIIRIIKYLGMKPILAVNPKTNIKEVLNLAKKTKHVLIMGVNPGKEKQRLLINTYSKIKELRKLNKQITIQVDGGVTEKNSKKLFSAGANILNSGSYVSNSKDPKQALKNLLK